MNQSEYDALEKRIAERDRIKAMADDLTKSKKDAIANRLSESKKATLRGEKPWNQ